MKMDYLISVNVIASKAWQSLNVMLSEVETLHIILVILIILFFAFQGFFRAVFEAIQYYNTIQHYFKKLSHKKFWSRELFNSVKDRNKDGKVSLMEKLFPNDGGHWSKHFDTTSLYISCGFIIATSNLINWQVAFITVTFSIWFRSAIFEIFLKKFQNKKP